MRLEKDLILRILDEEEDRIIALEIAIESLRADIGRESNRLTKLKSQILNSSHDNIL